MLEEISKHQVNNRLVRLEPRAVKREGAKPFSRLPMLQRDDNAEINKKLRKKQRAA